MEVTAVMAVPVAVIPFMMDAVGMDMAEDIEMVSP